MRSKSLRDTALGLGYLAIIVCTAPALAAEAGPSATINGDAFAPWSRRAFIDFHARSGPNVVGHSFIVYGRLDDRGQITEAQVAGLYTDQDDYLRGLLIPLHGVVGRTKYDLKEPSAIIYRRYLTEEQIYRIDRGVHRLKAIQHVWHLIFFNCNDFIGEIAELIGLHRPPSLMLPVVYVASLKALNH